MLLFAVSLLAGCASHEPVVIRDELPLLTPEGRPRSLALPLPRHRRLERWSGAPDRPLPWYANREDNQPSVLAGVQSPVETDSVTFTIDRQAAFRGWVFDQYHSTTYRRRVSETLR